MTTARCSNRTRWYQIALPLLALLVTSLLPGGRCFADRGRSGDRLPNVVVIFIDDMGYGDISPFGAQGYKTPHLDQMAREGMRFTDFVVSSAVCSASRSALLTGCYHVRVGFHGALGPNAEHGIAANEVTLAEICRQKGYATACFGKWHLGHHPKFLPLQHGFDEYFGLPYSNDMWPLHPAYAHLPSRTAKRKAGYPELPLIGNNEVIDPLVDGGDQEMLTTWYTERAVNFIERNRDNPFFLYVPHSMVHVPLFVSSKFAGKSTRGLFGDVVMEIDWSVGQILDTLRRLELDRNTLVIFTSDNGPWLSYGDHAGTAGPLREGKGTSWEGGIREPTIMWWPGQIRSGTTCRELASTIDILPTVAHRIGASLPDHPIDGKDIWHLMTGQADARSPHDALLTYYAGGQLQAVRDREWKLYFPHQYRTMAGNPGGTEGAPNRYEQRRTGIELYHLASDVSETTNVVDRYPQVTARLMEAADRGRETLGDRLLGMTGSEVRSPDRLTPSDPRLSW